MMSPSVHSSRSGAKSLQLEREFSRNFCWSIVIHGIVLISLVIKLTVFPTKPISYFPTLRVDLVALPEVLKKDLSKMSLSEGVSETHQQEFEKVLKKPQSFRKELEKVKPEEMVFKPKPKEGDLEQVSRQKKMKSALARIKALNKVLSEPEMVIPPTIKGNIISRGSSLAGEARESQMTSYYDTLRNHLQLNWALPVWIARQGYSAQVQLFLDSRGRLHHFKFNKLSGSNKFDEAVKRTLIESDPYPTPPSDLERSLLMDGILVGFPL